MSRTHKRPQLSLAPPEVERAGRVVVVEPDTSRRDLLGHALGQDGCDCILLADRDELFSVVTQFEPDLLLLTVEPCVNPIALLGDVRAQSRKDPYIPVILLGRGADELAMAGGLLAGADDFVSDITRLHELRARVRVQLRNRRFFDTLQRVRVERDLLRHDARVDPLTGLLNRRSLETAVKERCAAGAGFGVLFMDIDQFKSINDRFGHETGDRVLVKVGETLKAGLRPGDLVARYGGEEFLALIAGAGPESTSVVAERLRKDVEEMRPLPYGPERVTLSIGTTVFDAERFEEAPEELFRRADRALYVAKRAGRNRVVLVTADATLPDAPPDADSSVKATRSGAEANPMATQTGLSSG